MAEQLAWRYRIDGMTGLVPVHLLDTVLPENHRDLPWPTFTFATSALNEFGW